MNLIAKVTQIDKKFGWSFLGFILAAMFGGIAIYTEFIRDTSPVVKFEILNNTKILDIKEDVSGLSIIYNAEDIRKSHKTLSVLIIKISNEGRSPILKTYYDSASPLGLSINSGEVIKAEVMTATTDYLRQNAAIHVHDPSNVEFSPIIIEPNESFTVKFLILNPEQSTITIFPKGKIAGVKKLLLSDLQSDQTKETFLIKVVSGSIWVQVLRIFTYVIIFILLLIVIIAPVAYISDKKDHRRRNRVIRQFKSITDSSINELNAEIYKLYRQYGIRVLKRMKKHLAGEKEFQSFISTYKAPPYEANESTDYDALLLSISADSKRQDEMGITPALINLMMILGLISKDGERYTRNEEKIKAMNEFISFVGSKKAYNI